MRLQESYKELEAMKDKLENNETMWKLNLTDAQKEADKTKSEVRTAIRWKISILEKILRPDPWLNARLWQVKCASIDVAAVLL